MCYVPSILGNTLAFASVGTGIIFHDYGGATLPDARLISLRSGRGVGTTQNSPPRLRSMRLNPDNWKGERKFGMQAFLIVIQYN